MEKATAEGLAANAGIVFLSPKRAAVILDLKESTLERWRVIGRGPRYRKLNGAVRYSITDIQHWVNQCQSGGQRSVAA